MKMATAIDIGYLLENALRRGFWAAVFLAALLILITGQVTI